MEKLVLRIDGMCCAEEIATLKRALRYVAPEEDLAFDLMNGRLTVLHGAAQSAEIVAAVNKTGMRATPWAEHLARAGDQPGLWARHGQALLAGGSALAVVAGFAVHGANDGIHGALGGAEESPPIAAILLYIAGTVAGAWRVLPKALYALRALRPDMNLLMTVAVAGAIYIGEWFEAATVACLFAIALLLESWSVGRARRAIGALMDLAPQKARFICPNDGDIEEKPVAQVPPNVIVLVRPGERFPLDGLITRGTTTVNQAPITGESIPVTREPGDKVYAGTINEDGAVEYRAQGTADDTTLARIIRMVEEAQQRRARSEQWVERFARIYTPIMMLVALLVALVPPILGLGAWSTWFYQALVLLVIACPCALVISTPVSIVAGLSCAARHGVLIKGGVWLEAPARIKAIALDKTGTLTQGRPVVQRVAPMNGHTEVELLERAAALETGSEHPIARAILARAREVGISVGTADDFRALRGRGAEGRFDGRLFWIGSHHLMHEKGAETPEIHDTALAMEDAGHSVIAIGNDNHVCGLISVGDAVREESAASVAAMKAAGIRHVAMLTGDNEGTAQAIAALTGVDTWRAELLPEDKVEAVRRLVREHGEVAMVGDGVNDAPAMAEATLGIAMGAMGTDVAIETADIALMSDDLSKIAWLVRHSKRTLAVIKQNITFALGLKLIFVLLAVSGHATLWMAIAADMGASLLVIFNGLRLLRD